MNTYKTTAGPDIAIRVCLDRHCAILALITDFVFELLNLFNSPILIFLIQFTSKIGQRVVNISVNVNEKVSHNAHEYLIHFEPGLHCMDAYGL